MVGVDQHRGDEPDDSDCDEDRLPCDVVPGIARDVVARDPGNRPEPVADDRADGADEEPVEALDERRDVGGFTPAGSDVASAARAGQCPAQGDADSGRKRDDIAKRLDAQSLAAAKLAIQTFTPEPQPDDAVNVATPAGGWDSARQKLSAVSST